MSGPFGSERYGRHKALAILATFVLGYLAVRIFAPEWQGSIPWTFARSPKRAWEERVSDVPVRAIGVLEEAMPDSSMDGRPAARWRARTRDGHPFTWLQLPQRPPVTAEPGDSVLVRGRYSWDSTGGTVVTGSGKSGELGRVWHSGRS